VARIKAGLFRLQRARRRAFRWGGFGADRGVDHQERIGLHF